jgi:hypothetical protein
MFFLNDVNISLKVTFCSSSLGKKIPAACMGRRREWGKVRMERLFFPGWIWANTTTFRIFILTGGKYLQRGKNVAFYACVLVCSHISFWIELPDLWRCLRRRYCSWKPKCCSFWMNQTWRPWNFCFGEINALFLARISVLAIKNFFLVFLSFSR